MEYTEARERNRLAKYLLETFTLLVEQYGQIKNRNTGIIMRNHFFVLTVLAVTFWTGRGDQPTRDDFYLDDLTEGSGSWASEDSEWDSSMSEYTDYDSEDGPSGDEPTQETVYGSIHLNKVFKKEYLDPSSVEYSTLATNFVLSMRETMELSPLSAHYLDTFVRGFSPGSVKVDFGIQLQNFGNDEIVIEDSVSQIINDGISRGRFDDLSANASSLVVRASPPDPEEPTTPSRTDSEITPKHTEPAGDDNMNTKSNIYRGDDDDDDGEVNMEEKNKDIIEMILGDPIIIAAIVGGIIVILLSVILLFLFVVYRLKKKDEGSYSLDEPAKSKDPTAYWKETKEFYA